MKRESQRGFISIEVPTLLIAVTLGAAFLCGVCLREVARWAGRCYRWISSLRPTARGVTRLDEPQQEKPHG